MYKRNPRENGHTDSLQCSEIVRLELTKRGSFGVYSDHEPMAMGGFEPEANREYAPRSESQIAEDVQFSSKNVGRRAQIVKGSKMKVTKKPVRRKIVVALLGMCLAVSSYTIPTSEASPTQEQVTPAVQSAAAATTVQNSPGSPPSRLVPFWNPFWPFYYSYYGYYYYYYYFPYFFFYYY